MSDQPTTSQLPVVLQKPESIVELVKQNLPEMQSRHNSAMAVMQSLKKPTNDEEYEANNNILVKAKKTYDLINAKRVLVSEKLDEIKDFLMQFERPLDYGTKAKSLYNDIRRWQEEYKQEELNRVNREKAEIELRKKKEDRKVEIAAQIEQQLNAMVTSKEKALDGWVRAYFAKATSATFKEIDTRFKSTNPKLNEKDWEACFVTNFSFAPLTEEEEKQFLVELREKESYAKWAEEVTRRIGPEILKWRTRTGEFEQAIKAREAAKSEEEQAKVLAEQRAKQEEEDRKRQQEIDQAAEAKQRAIDEEVQKNKLMNSFQQQAVEQTLDNTGPTKKVLKFEDPKMAMPFTHVIYQTFASPKFKGIIKMKDGKAVLDASGRPEYIDAVQWWLNEYTRCCDINKPKIDHLVVFEDAKIMVKK